jgi:hypothetical protein
VSRSPLIFQKKKKICFFVIIFFLLFVHPRHEIELNAQNHLGGVLPIPLKQNVFFKKFVFLFKLKKKTIERSQNFKEHKKFLVVITQYLTILENNMVVIQAAVPVITFT